MVEILKPKTIVEEKIIGISGSISYLIEMIIQLSKYVNGRGLSKNGVNALLLFFLTFGLLISYAQMPMENWDKLKLFFVPLIFLLYAIGDFAKNTEKINKFFKRIGQRTEFTYGLIMEGNIIHEDLEYNLSILPFTSEQFIEIIKKLIQSGQFTPKVQESLLLNNLINRVDAYPFIKDSFIGQIDYKEAPINIEWAPSSVCIFLSKMKNNLTDNYLDKLFERYGKYPSVLVALGYFHHYRSDEKIDYFKMGYEFKYSKHLLGFLNFLMLMNIGIVLITVIALLIVPQARQMEYMLYFLIASIVFVIIVKLLEYVRENNFVWSLKKHIKNFDTLKDNYVNDKIINELYEAFYFDQ